MLSYFTMEIRAVRGMHDLYGEQLAAWTYVESKVKAVLHAFGYQEIRTPVLEKLEVFKGTVGDETDIVEKQMYTIEKRTEGDKVDAETLVMRPEGTASFIRAVLEHQLQKTGGAQRFFYYLPMFRYERPQKGRLRQFHQFGAELINDPSPEADAEIITVLDQIYKTFGVTEYKVRINSVGCADCRPIYKEKLKGYFRPHLASLCELCQKRFERSPLRILDCKRETCKLLAKTAPLITESLCLVCKSHHTALRTRLGNAGVHFEDDPYIVRGLDYYTRTAFEFTSELLGAQDALGGGGRYDGISARFGAQPFPAVGFGLGMERLVLALEAKKVIPSLKAVPSYYFAPLGKEAFDTLFPISMKLRRKGIWVELAYADDKSLKSQLKQANRSEAKFTLILGDDEMKAGNAILKDMTQGTQSNIPLHSLETELLRRANCEA